MEVALVGDAALDRRDLGGAFDPVADLAGDLRVAGRVPFRDFVRLPGSLEPLARELADRLQHPEAAAVCLHERLVDE